MTPPAAPSARTLWLAVAGRDGVLVRADADGDPLPRLDRPGALAPDGAAPFYLGRLDGEDCWAVAAPSPVPPGYAVAGLRALWARVDEVTWGVAGRAVPIVDWDATHRFCGRDGTPTEQAPDERAKRCPRCGLTAYPRLAPATITLVRRGREALLARNARFPSGLYSCVAGFVEPGESLEESVVREVREEVGVEVEDVRYAGSQPWPFPHSLMIGFTARWAGGEIRLDDEEIADAAWFRPDDLPRLPLPLSIARRLIDAWVRETTGPERGATRAG